MSPNGWRTYHGRPGLQYLTGNVRINCRVSPRRPVSDYSPGKAYLAYGTADGAVGLIAITQTLQSVATLSGIGENHTVFLSYSLPPQQPSAADGRSISSMHWVETISGHVRPLEGSLCATLNLFQIILVVFKPGVVHLWPALLLAAIGSTWDAPRTIYLQTQKTSVGSSALLPVSGTFYEPKDDSLIISLYDGSFHVIHGLSNDPTYNSKRSSRRISTDTLSNTARVLFMRAEAREIQKTDANRTSGMMSYDQSSTVLWVHECVKFATRQSSELTHGADLADRPISVTNMMPSTMSCLSWLSYGKT